ncbi:MAG: FAD-dependent oxidoreductase [Deltaproteobacteria bacterium]|nr:FAD-dependent oxidoreductase [Deltaproteobacteria bacterium]
METIAILGTGIAGDEAAFAAKKTNPNARIVLIGREPHALYSACVLADYVSGEIPKDSVLLRKAQDYEDAGIELMLSRRVVDWSAEEQMLFFEESNLSYDRLILATGSKSFIPPIPGVEKDGVVTLKTLDDAEKMKTAKGKSAVVVGSGPVGIEVAVAFQHLGWSVSIVELLDRILPRIFDVPLTEALTNCLMKEGINIFPNEKVLEISGNKRVKVVITNKREIPADIVVMVVGMAPEVQLAKKAGLVFGASGGISVNDRMETSIPGIWACGDCVESKDLVTGKSKLYMLWNNARLQGRTAGANAAGADKRYSGSFNITTVSFFGNAAASAGCLASEFSEEEVDVFHSRKWWGSIWLVLQGNRLAGVQAMGRTERVGGLFGSILRGQDLREAALKGPRTSGWLDIWALQGIERQLLKHLA